MSEAGDRRRGKARARPERPIPRDAQEALARARDHAQTALAEAVLAGRCLLDAASLGTTGVPAEGHDALRRTAQWLDRTAAAASGATSGNADRWLTTVAQALEVEIARWEARSRVDPEARAVLRAFLGVRELLWEFGLRRGPDATPPAATRKAPPRTAAPAHDPEPRTGRPARLERVPVDRTEAAEPGRRSG